MERPRNTRKIRRSHARISVRVFSGWKSQTSPSGQAKNGTDPSEGWRDHAIHGRYGEVMLVSPSVCSVVGNPKLHPAAKRKTGLTQAKDGETTQYTEDTEKSCSYLRPCVQWLEIPNFTQRPSEKRD